MVPEMRQPPGTLRAVVAGRPPRWRVPSSGSTRRILIRAPSVAAERAMRSRRASGQADPRQSWLWMTYCSTRTSAVDGSPLAMPFTTASASPSPPPLPPADSGVTSAGIPSSVSRPKFSNGKLAAASCSPARCANSADRAAISDGSTAGAVRVSPNLAAGKGMSSKGMADFSATVGMDQARSTVMRPAKRWLSVERLMTDTLFSSSV